MLGHDLQHVAVWGCKIPSLWIHCGSGDSKHPITITGCLFQDNESNERKYPMRKLKDASREQQRLSPFSKALFV